MAVVSLGDSEAVTGGVWMDEIPAVSRGALALRADVGSTGGAVDFEDTGSRSQVRSHACRLQETVMRRSCELVEADLSGVLAVEGDVEGGLNACSVCRGRFRHVIAR